MTTIPQRISSFNRGRDPELLSLKYQKMRKDIFGFFRGACHLFYEDWPADSMLNTAPVAWLCGDLHLENFGVFRADNGLPYFDMNDFDEAVLAPCTWDLARFLSGLLVRARFLNFADDAALALCHTFLASYSGALSLGTVRCFERDTAEGLPKTLLLRLKRRTHKQFLDDYTIQDGKKRTLNVKHDNVLPVTEPQRKKVIELLDSWVAAEPERDCFKLLDVVHLVSGMGSLGLERYLLLVKGDGSPHGNWLLDLKQASAPSATAYLRLRQPEWSSQAARITAIQTRCQVMPSAHLHALELENASYVLKQLQPSGDGIKLDQWKGKPRDLEKLVRTMGELVAWNQLRGSGRQGSALADDLIAFAQTADWSEPLLEYVQYYRAQVEADYQAFLPAP